MSTTLLLLTLLALPLTTLAALDTWFVDSTTKVFRDDPPGATKTARLTAAANEFEAVQLVIRPGDEPLKAVEVTVSDLTSDAGDRIPASQIEVLRVAYVYLPAIKRDVPDPLPPWTPTDIAANTNQPAWLDINVPASAAPGLYRATVTVSSAGATLATLPIELRVWPFALPATPRTRGAFGVYTQGIEGQHHVTAGSPQYNALLQKYYGMLLDHRATPRDLAFGLESPETAEYMKDPRVNAFLIPYSDDDAELKARVDYARKMGWADKGYFYVMDEPITQEHYDILKERAAKIHALGADLKIVVPYFREAAFEVEGGMHGLLTGVCGIWCPKPSFLREDFLASRQALGEELWWYVCWEPGAPYANLYLDMTGIEHRALFWQQAHYNVTGFLYWTSNYWNPATGTADPWTDMATVRDLSDKVYGDGSVLYPGPKVGIDGPVASIRLKLIREGLEDVEYLRLLEDKQGRAALREFTGQVVQAPNAFSHDTEKYLQLREQVAQRLSN
jgi:hypothetical protein